MKSRPLPRVVIADATPPAEATLRNAFTDAGLSLDGVVPYLDGYAERAADVPDVIVLDVAAAGRPLPDAVRDLQSRWHECCILVTGDAAALGQLSHAVTAGARGFLIKPYLAADLAATIREAQDSLGAARPVARSSGEIVAVYSPSGGAGTTTTAVNLAVLLARSSSSVALVDLDLQFGDVAVMLDVKSPSSILDLLGQESLAGDLVSDVFVRHQSGVHVLAAPSDIGAVGGADPDRLARSLDQLREHFDIIVCDLWSNLDAISARVLRMADCVVLLTKPELPALKNMVRVLGSRELRLDQGDGRVLMVANRMPSKGGLSDGEVRHALSRPLAGSIPSDGGAVVEALNRGIPAVDPRLHSRATPGLQLLAEAVRTSLASARSRPVAVTS